jgi:hypothetical protein
MTSTPDIGRLSALWRHLMRRERRAWSQACRAESEPAARPWLARHERARCLRLRIEALHSGGGNE